MMPNICEIRTTKVAKVLPSKDTVILSLPFARYVALNHRWLITPGTRGDMFY